MKPTEDYYWTDEAADGELACCDAIEIAGCTDDGQATERVDDSDHAQFFSVYGHLRWGGCTCIADRNTLAEARAYAASKAKQHGLPINDFT